MPSRPTPFASMLAQTLEEPFALVDLGCSGGLPQAWRVFGEKLRAFGFDPNVAEVRRMTAAETLPLVEYVACFVGTAGRSPVMAERTRLPWSRIPAHRFSYHRTREITERQVAAAETGEKTRLNEWQKTDLADTRNVVELPKFFRERGVTDLDYLKIDVDGTDYEILRDIEPDLDRLGVLAVQIEVNFWGSDSEDDHTLHNIDRLMKRAGFELMDLNHRRYSTRHLPAPYVAGIPAETASGRIYQGDAVFIRDLAQTEWRGRAAAASPDKLAKLAAIFAAHDLPDCAAEILIEFRDRFAGRLDVEAGLDLLAAQAQAGVAEPVSYREYIARFEANDPAFYAGGVDDASDSDADIDLSAIANPSAGQLWRKIGQQEREQQALDARWRAEVERVNAHAADLDARWQAEMQRVNAHSADLDARWQAEMQRVSAHAADLDRRWQAIHNESQAEWTRQKAEYERQLAAARGTG